MASPNWLQARSATIAPVQASQNIQIETKITALQALTQSLIATGTGFALGVAHSELRNGLDVHGKPADLIGSVVFGTVGYFFNSQGCMTVSHVCEGVYGFRKAVDLLKVLEMSPRKKADDVKVKDVTDDIETDPVVAAGKDIDDVPEVVTVHGESVAAE